MELPKNIDEVILHLEQIIQEALDTQSPLGLFAALYRKVTLQVKEGIAQGRFEDNARMERLDVVFANRYLQAYQEYTSGQQPTKSWQTAFDATKQTDLILLQHLFVGMNAHISLDLGIAAAQVASAASVEELKNDFMEINQLLFELIEEVQAAISKVSPFLGLIDWFARKKDEQLAQFSMKAARDHAWVVAQRMDLASDAPAKTKVLEQTDTYVAKLNQLILNPKRLTAFIYWIIRLRESKDINKNIQALIA